MAHFYNLENDLQKPVFVAFPAYLSHLRSSLLVVSASKGWGAMFVERFDIKRTKWSKQDTRRSILASQVWKCTHLPILQRKMSIWKCITSAFIPVLILLLRNLTHTFLIKIHTDDVDILSKGVWWHLTRYYRGFKMSIQNTVFAPKSKDLPLCFSSHWNHQSASDLSESRMKWAAKHSSTLQNRSNSATGEAPHPLFVYRQFSF